MRAARLWSVALLLITVLLAAAVGIDGLWADLIVAAGLAPFGLEVVGEVYCSMASHGTQRNLRLLDTGDTMPSVAHFLLTVGKVAVRACAAFTPRCA